MIEVRQTEVFASWFTNLRDRKAKARVQVRIDRMEVGNFGDVAPVGQGVSEMRIAYGHGYRVYFVQKGPILSYFCVATTRVHKVPTLLKLKRSLINWRIKLWQ